MINSKAQGIREVHDLFDHIDTITCKNEKVWGRLRENYNVDEDLSNDQVFHMGNKWDK